VVRRAEMLAELMRLKSNVAVAGTHGKTTTTTMVAALLDAGGIDPTVINGGIIHAYGSNARMGQGDWMVVEADESDGTFNRLPATIAIVTNIDPEHMEHWGTIEALRDGFDDFVSNIPFYGLAVCCTDHPRCRRWWAHHRPPRRDLRLQRAGRCARGEPALRRRGRAHFDIALQAEGQRDRGLHPADAGRSQRVERAGRRRRGAASGHEGDADPRGAGRLRGVNRRFTKVGEVERRAIIDDYGHHPVEIAAVLKAARQATEGRRDRRAPAAPLHAPVDLFDDFCACFNDADVVAIAEVFAAGRRPDPGASRDDLVAG
jgi:UDP-N-acetylmuramate--alanine ligase